MDQSIKHFQGYTLHSTYLGKEQLFITAHVNGETDSYQDICESIYHQIGESVHKAGMHIVLERIFGNLNVRGGILEARRRALESSGESPYDPVTFVQGRPVINPDFAGIQLRAVRPTQPDRIWKISMNGEPFGQGWRRNGTTYLLLQNIHGASEQGDNSRKAQTARMFDRTLEILKTQGADYRHVVRTWIYLSKILDWYGEFNEVRNLKYQAFSLIQDPSEDKSTAERIYLPASTGIEGDNPASACGTMDVLALIQNDNSHTEIIPITGKKQRSAFRYGSAFSRAMALREEDATQILLSGTASIDESGETVYKGDTRAQILKTLEVIGALLGTEGADLKNIAKATVFLKNRHDYELYLKTMEESGLPHLPAVVVEADVCRHDLLFELDAVAVLKQT